MNRNKRKSHNGSSQEASDQERLARLLRLGPIDSPFQGMPRDQVDAALIELGNENMRVFDESLARLRKSMLTTDPVKLLSNLAVYGVAQSEEAALERGIERPYLQLHSELIQAFALMHKQDEYAVAMVVPPALIQETFDTIKLIGESYTLKGTAVASAPKTDEERRRLVSQAAIRAQTVAVRNLGYPDQLRRHFTHLVAPLDQASFAETGLRLTSLLEFLWNVIDLIDERFRTDSQKQAGLFAATTIEDAVSAFYAAYPDLTGDPAATIAILRGQGVTLESAKLFLHFHPHREMSFPGYFTLTWADLISCYRGSVTIGKLRHAMDTWSLMLGDLAARDPEHFFLDNPIWSQPFIRLNDDEFFCPVAGVLWSFSLRLIEEFVSNKTSLKGRYELRRDKFLESQVDAVLRKAFPSAKVYSGSVWTDPVAGRNGENDHLVILGDVALIFEDKAGNVPDKALRAHPERLAWTLDDLVVRPAEQARNFIALLERDPGPHKFKKRRSGINEVDVSEVRLYIPVSVTWETFGAFRLRWPLLQGAGLIPENAELAVTMSLADLETVLDVLDTEIQRLHYLVRRSELDRNERVVGDEVDLLGHFLNTGFRGAELAPDRDELIDLTMQSKRVDSVIEALPSARPAAWPGTRLTPLWQALLADLDTRRPTGWVQASLLLSSVPFAHQEQFGHVLEGVASKARRTPLTRASKKARRTFRAAGLTLVAMGFKGFTIEEILDFARSTVNLDTEPAVISVCIRVENRSSPVVGL
jgi:hypothetical protein